MDPTAAIAATLSGAKDQRGISYATLEEATGIPETTLKRSFAGQRPFTTPQLFAVADVLGLDVVRIVADATQGSAA